MSSCRRAGVMQEAKRKPERRLDPVPRISQRGKVSLEADPECRRNDKLSRINGFDGGVRGRAFVK